MFGIWCDRNCSGRHHQAILILLCSVLVLFTVAGFGQVCKYSRVFIGSDAKFGARARLYDHMCTLWNERLLCIEGRRCTRICVTPNGCCENVQSNEQFAKLRSLPSTWLRLVESRKRWLVDLREMAGIRFESTLEYCLVSTNTTSS